VDFTDVALNDGQVFDTSTFSPTQSGYFWLAASAVGFVGQTMTLAMVSTAADETNNGTQVTLNVHNAALTWCTSFVDISYISKGDKVSVMSKHPINVSSDASETGQNRSYSFVGFQLDSILKHPIFSIKSDFELGGLTKTTFQNGTSVTATENATVASLWNTTELITTCLDNCINSTTDIIPQKAGWYLISVSIHCRINVNSSIADSESARNKSMWYNCHGSLKGFYSTNSSTWNVTRSQLLPVASASFTEIDRHQNWEADLVASSSALIFLHPGDILHPYAGTESSNTSMSLFSVRALLYEPAHSYKAAWSVLCVNSNRSSTSNTDRSGTCDIVELFEDIDNTAVSFSPHAENVAYDPDSMAVALDINGIYYIAFTAIVGVGLGEYTSCSVLQHTQNSTKSVLGFTYPDPSTPPKAKVSIERSRLLLVRERDSLTCKAYSADPNFEDCLYNSDPTFYGFLLYPV
jgi:hypothetical protein